MLKRIALALLMMTPAFAQRPALVSPVIRFQDNNGVPLAGGKLFTYQAGTTTPLSTYVDSTSGTLNTNPVILDSTGSATIFLGNNVYKLVLQNSAGTVQWTADNIAENAFNQGGGGSPTGPCGGDLTGTFPNCLVHKVNGAAVPVSQAYVGTNSAGQLIAGSALSIFYQTVQTSGTPAPQEPVLNLIPGSGTAITCADNPTNHSTDCTFNLSSSSAVDYYWTEAGCVIGVGQPNHCDFTATLPGAMPSASYQVFCTLNFLADTPAAACNLAQSTLPMTSGGSLLMRIGQYQQDGTTGTTAPTIYMHAHYGSGGGGGGGSGGFPITLGTTAITSLSTTTALAGLTVNGVVLASTGSTTLFLNQAGGYTAPTGTGTVTSVATSSPLAGGPITTSGTITCPTCVTASSPGVGLAHFAGSTQAVTSSAVNLAANVTGLLPHANIASTAVTPGSYTCMNGTVAADGSITGASSGSCGGSGNTTSTSLTTNKLPKANGANSIIDSGWTDDGTTATYHGSGSYNSTGAAPNLFSALPSCTGNEGQTAPVTDSTTNTVGATITGSGSDHVLAYCNGTNWTVGTGTSSGGSGIVASAEVVSFSATPTFSTTTNVSRIVLTSNITSFTLGSTTDGQDKTLCFKQGSGPYTVTPPSGVHGFFTIGVTNGLWNCQNFVYDNTDSIWIAVGTGVINE